MSQEPLSQEEKPTRKKTIHNWLKAAILAAFLTVAISYSIIIPAGEGVDEIAHFDYVRFIKEQRSLPIQPMTRGAGVKVWMGHHPPLYYSLAAMVISWTDTSDFTESFRPNPHFVWQENDGSNGWNAMMHFGQDDFPWRGSVLALQVVRLFNIILASIALYAIYRSTELLFSEHPWVPLGVTAVIAFNPSFIYMSSTVHHDVLQATIFALAMWWILHFLTKPERKYDAVAAGVLIGSTMLTKLSGLTLAVVIGMVFLIKAFRERAWQSFLRHSIIAFGVAFLVAGWWYIRNWLLYGDLLGWQMFLNIHRHMVRSTSYTWSVFRNEFLAQIGRTFWGGFGFMHITFPEIARYFWWLVGLSLIGLFLALIRGQLNLRRKWAEWLTVVAVLILLFISFVRFSIATMGAGHGRYLFPAAFSVGVLIVAGLNGFTCWRHQRAISIVLALGLLVYAIWLPITRVSPKYEALASAGLDELAQTIPIDLQLTQGLRLVAYETEQDRVTPGQQLSVNLFWQADGDPTERQDPLVRVGIIDDQGAILASSTTWPVASLSPDVWPTEAIYTSETSLMIPPESVTERLYLAVAPVYRTSEDDEYSQISSEYQLITEIVSTGMLARVGLEDTPIIRHEVLADQIELLGFEVEPDPVLPAGVLLVDLYWRVLEVPTADYTAFVHLLNEQGELVTQFDRPVGGTSAPTTTWNAGEVLRDTYPLTIPEDTPAGDYSLQIGMYTWPSLERLSVKINAQPIGDSVDLGKVRVGP